MSSMCEIKTKIKNVDYYIGIIVHNAGVERPCNIYVTTSTILVMY